MKPISLNNINSWSDFKSYAESMPNTKSMGDTFEQLTKLYFQIDPIYRSKYDNIWLLDEVPSKDLEYLDLPRQDLGIDLIAKSGDEYHAIQCKYHSDKNNTVKNSEISTFTSILANKKNLSHGYICSTALNTSRNFNTLEIQNISNILFDKWSTLDQEFFDNARKILKKKKPKVTPFIPKPHQKNAITLAHKHFVKENNSRGKLIFPCGSGKSLTGFWMMEKLKANSTVVAVPSLSLVKQTLEVYLKQVVAKKMEVKWLCICSDEGIGKGDDVVTYTRDLPVPCTTDPDYIKNWLKQNKKENIIIFTTYQSGRLIAEASKSLKFTFDLGIYDEAHKTVGKNENLFSYLLFEENISVKHRIFMTATERFYRGVRDDVLTMDDPDDYGDVFCHMSFKEAIEQDLLTDYKIITIEVKKEEIAAFIKDNNLVKSNAKWGKENEARSLASMIALRKAMKTLPIKNAVSFHSSIERATRNKEVQKHITETYKYKPIDTYHVSGKLPTTKRNDVVQEFAKSNSALITNSRCLTEGVDVPNIDCIVFADPRKSKVDIVQALGRALRKKDSKEWGYVVLPVIYDHTSNEIDNENFQEILNVVRGLAANDERIVEEFKDKSKNGSGGGNTGGAVFKIDPTLLNEDELVNNLRVKIWENLSRFNWMPFDEARSYVRKLNLKSSTEYINLWRSGGLPKNIPAKPRNVYKGNGFISMPDFLGYDSIFQDWLSYDEAKKIVASFNFKSVKEFRNKAKLKELKNIPKVPERVYQNSGWTNWKDFLGNTNISKELYYKDLDFSDFRVKARKIGFRSITDYIKNRPKDFPIHPQRTFKNKGWTSWSDYLGIEIKKSEKSKMPFKEQRAFVRKLNLKSHKEWKNYVSSGLKPDYITSKPSKNFKDTGWAGIHDWLGCEPPRNSTTKEWLSFDEARKYVHSLKLKSTNEWRQYCKSDKRPMNIPSKPTDVYPEFKGYNDWLNTNNLKAGSIEYLSFEKARKYVRKLNLKGIKEWKEYINSENYNEKIPKAPFNIYKNKGFVSIPDFLGYEATYGISRKEATYNEVKMFCAKLKVKSANDYRMKRKEGKLPSYFPSTPSRYFQNKGWSNWAEFLDNDIIRTDRRIYLPFNEAKLIVRKENMKTTNDWKKYSKNKRPLNIPSNPDKKYKGEWKGWTDFLGKED